MEIDIDTSPTSSSVSSFPHFVPYTQRAFVNALSFTPSSLSRPLSGCPSPASAFDTTTDPPSWASTSTMSTFSQTQHDSSNTYSAYSDYGIVTSSLQASQEFINTSSDSSSHWQPGTQYSCVSPILLYSPSSIAPADTSSNSLVASLLATQGQTQASYRMQAIEDKLHEVERETESRWHPFACDVDDYQCRCRSGKGPRMSLPCLKTRSHWTEPVRRASPSAFGRPWRNWIANTRVRSVF